MCILTMQSVTVAMKAASALRTRGMECEVVGVDPSLTSRGCGYGVRCAPCDRESVEAALRARNIPFGEWLGNGRR